MTPAEVSQGAVGQLRTDPSHAEPRDDAGWLLVAVEWKQLRSWTFDGLQNRCKSLHLLARGRGIQRGGRRAAKMSFYPGSRDIECWPLMWHLPASPGMRAGPCHFTPPGLPLHCDLFVISTPRSEARVWVRAATDARGAAPTLNPLRWAAAEDHGPSVSAQASQRLPATVNLCQSRYLQPLLPSSLLPGCSNAAPARPATLLPPRVGGERATRAPAHWRERGEIEGQF